jgi:EPS-associated MarR family transcriptional regulator
MIWNAQIGRFFNPQCSRVERFGGLVMEKFAIDDEIHYRLIKRIEADPEASQRKLAAELGVSLGKVNYCLKALISVGWVKVGNFVRSNNKLGYVYVLTPIGIKEKARITALFLKKKQAQYEQLKAEIASLELELAQSESDAGGVKQSC